MKSRRVKTKATTNLKKYEYLLGEQINKSLDFPKVNELFDPYRELKIAYNNINIIDNKDILVSIYQAILMKRSLYSVLKEDFYYINDIGLVNITINLINDWSNIYMPFNGLLIETLYKLISINNLSYLFNINKELGYKPSALNIFNSNLLSYFDAREYRTNLDILLEDIDKIDVFVYEYNTNKEIKNLSLGVVNFPEEVDLNDALLDKLEQEVTRLINERKEKERLARLERRFCFID